MASQEPPSVGSNFYLAPLDQNTNCFAYNYNFINIKNVEPSLGVPSSFTVADPNTPYYFPIIANAVTYKASRRFSNKNEALVYYNDFIGIGTSFPNNPLTVIGTISGNRNIIIGDNNVANYSYSSILGGVNNTASGCYSYIGNGIGNTISGDYGYIAGGFYNNICGAPNGIINGGTQNLICGNSSIINGGGSNEIDSASSAIIGGTGNCICENANYSTIAGGFQNQTTGEFSFIAGGYQNTNSGLYSNVGGGYFNKIQSFAFGVLGGGFCNTTSGYYANGILGGACNNIQNGNSSAIVGGYCNNTSSNYAFIGSGCSNTVYGVYSSIVGGYGNITSGDCSFVAGGSTNNTSQNNTFLLGSSLTALKPNYTYVNNISVQNLADVSNLNVSNTAIFVKNVYMKQDLTVSGKICALSGLFYTATNFLTSEALRIENTGNGPALYISQLVNTDPIGTFVSNQNTNVFYIGNTPINPLDGTKGYIGVNTNTPNVEFTVNGRISSNSLIYANTLASSAGNSDQWTSVYWDVNSLSGNWQSNYINIQQLSANWQSVYWDVNSLSASWQGIVPLSGAYWNQNSLSANWQSVYWDVNSLSASWQGINKLSGAYWNLNSLSANWNSVYWDVNSLSANWQSVYADVNQLSSQWGSFTNNISALTGIFVNNLTSYYDPVWIASLSDGKIFGQRSTNWDTVYANNVNLSGNWNSVYWDVNSLSANWQSVYWDVNSLSANWQGIPSVSSAYWAVNSLSANWNSVYWDVNSLSGTWQGIAPLSGTYWTVNSLSANWNSVYWNINSLSGDWQNLYQASSSLLDTFATVSSLSANWDSVYWNVNSLSSSWQGINKLSGAYWNLNSLSANWQSVYWDVNSLSANWQSSYWTATGLNANLANYLPLTGGKLTGPLIINSDLSVNGTLTFTGSATYINTVNTVLADSLFYIASGNTANINDIGIVGHFTQSPIGYQHTGIVRRADTQQWTLFSGVTSEPLTATNIRWNDPTFTVDTLVANINAPNIAATNLAVNNTLLYTASGSNSVGINTITPNANLTVVGSISASGIIYGQAFAQSGSSIVQKYTTTIGDGITTSFDVFHNLTTQDVIVQAYDTITQTVVYPTVILTNSNAATVIFSNPPKLNQYKIIVIG